MATAEVINEDPFCDADLMPMEELDGKYSVVRLKNSEGEWIPIPSKGAIHGDGYRFVPNSKVQQMAVDVLTRSGREFKPLPNEYNNSKASNLTWDGKKFASRWFIEDINGDINDADNRSKLMLGVEAINSYDGSYKVGINFFAMSIMCQNQFYSQNLLGGFTFGHYDRAGTNLDQDLDSAVELIEAQAETFGRALPKLQALTNTSLADIGNGCSMSGYLDIRNSLQGTKKPWAPSHEPHVLDELAHNGVTARMGREQTAHDRNLWGLLNAYTAVSTHHVGGFKGAGLSQFTTDNLLQRVAS